MTRAAPACARQAEGAAGRGGEVNRRVHAGHQPTMSEPVASWHSGLPRGVYWFQDCDASQQATQQVGSGDDAPLRAPDQDQIVVDDVVLWPLRHNLQASDDLAEPRPHIPNDDRPVPPAALILAGLI